jgi:hypothetical protein
MSKRRVCFISTHFILFIPFYVENSKKISFHLKKKKNEGGPGPHSLFQVIWCGVYMNEEAGMANYISWVTWVTLLHAPLLTEEFHSTCINRSGPQRGNAKVSGAQAKRQVGEIR